MGARSTAGAGPEIMQAAATQTAASHPHIACRVPLKKKMSSPEIRAFEKQRRQRGALQYGGMRAVASDPTNPSCIHAFFWF